MKIRDYFKQIKEWTLRDRLGRGMLFLLKYYFAFILLSVIYKILFLAFNHGDESFSFVDYADIVTNGIKHDFAIAGYFTAIPTLLTLVKFYKHIPLRIFYKCYNTIIALAASLAFVADMTLYPYWKHKLDAADVVIYIDSPANAIASVTVTHLITLAIVLAALTFAIYKLLSYICRGEMRGVRVPRKKSVIHRTTGSLTYIIICGLLFLGIRGGVTESTNNIGTVYYTNRETLNHASVNPIFSFLHTLANLEDFRKEYSFYNEEELNILTRELYSQDIQLCDTLLKNNRPNIVTIILEGMGGVFVENLGGMKGVTPNIDRLSEDGVLFTQCYANSFRTDRGVLCTLSGFPSFPKTSVMKDANKCSKLPSLANSLKRIGYSNTFLYGGDINFTNMKGYLFSSGYDRLISNQDFTREEVSTHRWGAGDDITFNKLYEIIMNQGSNPWHITYLTLSSHEPWEVPYNRISNDEIANSFAFTDEMLGRFVEKLKATDKWDNTLIICIADHTVTGYSKCNSQTDRSRNQILFMMLGGAIKEPKRIDRICNQTDFVATILAQMQLPVEEFRFSRNIFSPKYTYPFAYHSYNNGISLIDSTGYSVYDLDGKREMTAPTESSKERIGTAKAILQSTYNHYFNL